QRIDDRTARDREVDAGRTLPRHPAAAFGSRGARGGGGALRVDQRLRRRALGTAALPRAASQRLGGGARRWWQPAATRRDIARAPWGAVPRRAAGVRPRRPRS